MAEVHFDISLTQNCQTDFINFVDRARGHTTLELKFFWYVGKASFPTVQGGALVGGGSTRQAVSFREHLPVDHPGFLERDGGCLVISGGIVRCFASYFYPGKSEKSIYKLVRAFTKGYFADIDDELNLNINATNGEGYENCYVHIYAVSNQQAHKVRI